MSRIPKALHEIADQLGLDLSGYEKDSQPIDPQLFGWMRHRLDIERAVANEEFDDLETDLDEIELQMEAAKEKTT